MKKIVDNYKRMAVPAKAAMWFAVSNILQKGISLISTPIFTRIMSTSQYGTYTLYQSWLSIIAVFTTLNLYSGVLNNGLTQHEDDKKELFISFQSLASLMTVVLFGVYLFHVQWFNSIIELPFALVVVMFIQMFFEPSFLYWSVEQRYDFKYKTLVLITFLYSFISVLVGVISVLLFSHKEYARILSFSGITAIIGAFFYFKNCYYAKKIWSVKYWKFALRFSLPLIPHYLASSILNQADRIMISKMVGKDEAAIYGIAYTLSMMMTLITNAIGNTYIPYVYKAIKKSEWDKIIKITNIIIIIVGGIVLCSILFGPELLLLFGSSNYYEARWIIPPVALSVFFSFLYTVYGTIEFYFEKTKFVMIASNVTAVINIGLNYIFIGLFGYLAAGYTTLISYILFVCFHFLFSKKIMKQNKITNIFDNRQIFLVSIIMIGCMFIFVCLYSFAMIRYAILLFLLFLAFYRRKKLNKIFSMIKGNK